MTSRRIAIASILCAAVLGSAVPAFADGFNFSFNVGDVRMGYSDGYWDNDHHWHNWRNSREAREFQKSYHDRYVASRHTRVKNEGWRDDDHDGVPNAVDRHPENPRRD